MLPEQIVMDGGRGERKGRTDSGTEDRVKYTSFALRKLIPDPGSEN